VDFYRMEAGPHRVERIERDPGRSGHIALIHNEITKRKSYILAAEGVRAGDVVQSYRSGIPADLLASMGGVVDPGMLAAKTAWRGNCLPLRMIPIGAVIHAISSSARGAAVFCRSAGTHATVIAKDDRSDSVVLRLQSGEVRRVKKDACATIGVVSNPTWQHRQLGKAGRSRWLNIRPTVRGLAMNAGMLQVAFFPLSTSVLRFCTDG
jgi:ribosomal protein L2